MQVWRPSYSWAVSPSASLQGVSRSLQLLESYADWFVVSLFMRSPAEQVRTFHFYPTGFCLANREPFLYSFFAALTAFLIIMTNFILLIGAGLFCKAVGDFQENAFNNLSVTHFFEK